MSVRDTTAGTALFSVGGRVGHATAARSSATISVVIPTLNEAANLPHVLARIPEIVDEVVLVDGHSKDGTIDVARTIRPDVRVVLQNGRGKGNALGLRLRRRDRRHHRDARRRRLDDPAEIPRFVAALLAGNDFAKGSRFALGGAQHRHHAAPGARQPLLGLAVNVLFGTRYTDLCYGYNAFWNHCLPHMHVTCDGFEVETLIHVRVARAGLEVVEIALGRIRAPARREQAQRRAGRTADPAYDPARTCSTRPRRPA